MISAVTKHSMCAGVVLRSGKQSWYTVPRVKEPSRQAFPPGTVGQLPISLSGPTVPRGPIFEGRHCPQNFSSLNSKASSDC
jgi:hypothetical protein